MDLSDRKAKFQANLQSRLSDHGCRMDTSPELLWKHLKSTILQTSEEILGFSSKKHRDWFDENNVEIQELLAKKRRSHQAHLAQPPCPVKKVAFRHACSDLQQQLRVIQNEWWTKIAERAQVCADIATTILNWWSEHFQTLFAANHMAQESAIQNILQQMVKAELDNCPILNKTVKAISQMKSSKVAGVDGIPPEVWKQGGSALHAKLLDFLIQCWEQGALPQDLHNSVILTLYKGKGDKMDCSNYRGITLLSISGKIRRYC